MATTSPVGIYYRTNAESPTSLEAQSLALANSVNSAVGLVPIIPSSVTVSSGSASVNSNGKITFTSCTSFAVDGIFSANFDHYRIIYAVTGAYTQTHAYKFRTNGVDNSGANYYFQEFYASVGSSGVGGWAGQTQGRMSYSIAGQRQTMAIDVINPFSTQQTEALCQQGSAAPNLRITCNGHTGAVSFTGMNFLLGAGADGLTGTMKIYGYR